MTNLTSNTKITLWFLYSDRLCATLAKLICREYGFDCDYVVEGEEDEVIAKFRDHMEMVHGIEYAYEAIQQFVLRKHDI